MNRQQTGIEPIRNSHQPQPSSSAMISSNRGESIEILLVEDDPGDAKRTTDALRDGRLRNRITHVEDGSRRWPISGARGSTPTPPVRT